MPGALNKPRPVVIPDTRARRDGSEWVLNGRKRWIGNAVWCDVIVVYARDTGDGPVKAFVVEKDNPGYAASKITCTVKARHVCRMARDILGGNGILLDFHVMRHMCDMEALLDYEGTAESQTLLVGRDITGQSAFT